MERPTMTALLKAEEETTRNQLRADDAVDRSRKQSADRLNEQLGQMLLRYNAAWSGDGRRQALADSMTAVVQDMLPLLTAGTAVKEIPKRKVRTGGVVLLLFAVIFALLCVILVRQYYPVGCAFLALAAVCGFLAGLLWHGEREVLVHAGLDPEIVWKTLLKTVETMDRKTESFLHDEAAAAAADIVSPAGAGITDPEALQLFGDLLEGLYSGNGDFALRQLRKLQPWLASKGIETRDYAPDTAEMFDLLPTRSTPATLRPALLTEGKLLTTGKATEREK